MKTIILATILGLSAFCGNTAGAVVPETSGSMNMGQALQQFYKAFQQIMPCGYTPENIPILAPFTLADIPINVTNEYLNVKGSISNLMVTGMNDFSFIQFAYNTTNNRTTFDLIFPSMQAVSEYEMDVWALLAGYPFQMAGNGLINVMIKDFRIVFDLALTSSLTNPNGLRVADFDLKFYVGDVQASNWNNLWNIAANNFVNRWIRDGILMWTEQIQPQVDNIYDDTVVPIINNALANVSMPELIAYFETNTQLWNMANCTLG